MQVGFKHTGVSAAGTLRAFLHVNSLQSHIYFPGFIFLNVWHILWSCKWLANSQKGARWENRLVWHSTYKKRLKLMLHHASHSAYLPNNPPSAQRILQMGYDRHNLLQTSSCCCEQWKESSNVFEKHHCELRQILPDKGGWEKSAPTSCETPPNLGWGLGTQSRIIFSKNKMGYPYDGVGF